MQTDKRSYEGQHIQIELEAHHEGRNVHRYYSIECVINLFSLYSVKVHYGRHGLCHAQGQQKVYLFDTKEEAMNKIHQILKKRLSSERRIGVNYSIVYSTLNPNVLKSKRL